MLLVRRAPTAVMAVRVGLVVPGAASSVMVVPEAWAVTPGLAVMAGPGWRVLMRLRRVRPVRLAVAAVTVVAVVSAVMVVRVALR